MGELHELDQSQEEYFRLQEETSNGSSLALVVILK